MKVLTPEGEEKNLMVLNIGPSHGATHGCLRYITALDGENIAASVGEIGYLHRGFEKTAERGTWQQVLPLTDRLDYCSAMMNNFAYCRAVEKMLGIEIPERAKVIRVIVNELSRIADHFICDAAAAQDLGSTTGFFYLFDSREQTMRIWEKLTGARLTNSYGRIGGLYRDDKKSGQPTGRDAEWHSYTGPCLRATGVASDVRKDEPYWDYETYDWKVVTGTRGDVFDRLMVRLAEAEESLKIIRQALKRLAPGPVSVEDPRVRVPSHERVYQDMEALAGRFKSVFEGIRVPAGEYYCGTETANGELGFTLVSDGSGHPWRVKVRPPCFTQFAAFHELVEGGLIADSIACLSSINIIAGELDR